jgi:amino acid transporter
MLTSVVEQEIRVDEGLKRTVGLLGLTWASEGSIIGSGWLFAALGALAIAGPASILCWIIAAVIIILLALVHAELGGMFPVTGGTSRYPHYAYGSFAGMTFGWFSYLQAAAVAPIEAIAAVTYMSSTTWGGFMFTVKNGHVSGDGFWITVGLMAFFLFMNLFGIRWWARSNNAITTWKVLVPLLAIVVLLAANGHISNFSRDGGFFFGGTGHTIPKSIMRAIPRAGIVFALLGFEQAVQLGGESKNPQRDLPRAVISSILLGAFIYIMAQLAFTAALNPATIVHVKTWASLAKTTLLSESPYRTVAAVAGLSWLAWILRFDAVISPGGTGMIYLTSSSRISFGLSKNGYIPEVFEKVTPKSKLPLVALVVAFLFGLIFLAPFHGWYALATAITSASVLMYCGAPLALGALRLQKPNVRRPYILPAGKVLAPAAFVLGNFIVYWSGWSTYTALMAGLLIGFGLMALSYAFKLNSRRPKIDWQSAVWVIPWLLGMGFITYFGNYGTGGMIGGIGITATVWVGANGDIPLWWDLLVVGGWSLFIYYMAIYRRLDTERVDHYVGTVHVEEIGGH